MRSVKENILRAEQLGYARINHFTLPDSCWWDEYYSPLLHNTERLASESKDDPVLARAVANARAEISLFHECSREYGYVFYLLQKSDITIERAQIDDSQDIARVLRTSFSAALPFISILHTRYEDFNYVRDQLFPTNQIFVARDAGCNVIGYIAFNDERINHLYIDPAATRQGTGTRLLNIAKLHNCKLRLWTFQKNENAQRFYQARGFYPIKETDGSGNEEHEPDILYEWKADLYR
jgi:GNAT superfamily N-acetyltransferase